MQLNSRFMRARTFMHAPTQTLTEMSHVISPKPSTLADVALSSRAGVLNQGYAYLRGMWRLARGYVEVGQGVC